MSSQISRRALKLFQPCTIRNISTSLVNRQNYEFQPRQQGFKQFNRTIDEDVAPESAPAFQKFSKPAALPSTTLNVAPFPEELQQYFGESAFLNIASDPFSSEVATILAEPINPDDVEIKPDGVCYLPEIKYRKTLIRAFGPGGIPACNC